MSRFGVLKCLPVFAVYDRHLPDAVAVVLFPSRYGTARLFPSVYGGIGRCHSQWATQNFPQASIPNLDYHFCLLTLAGFFIFPGSQSGQVCTREERAPRQGMVMLDADGGASSVVVPGANSEAWLKTRAKLGDSAWKTSCPRWKGQLFVSKSSSWMVAPNLFDFHFSVPNTSWGSRSRISFMFGQMGAAT